MILRTAMSPTSVNKRIDRLAIASTAETVNTAKIANDVRTTNSQFSVKGDSANDTAGGTGIQRVRVTYLDETFAGPFTEIFTMNGTARVNSVNTNFCYVDNVEVIAVGSDAAGGVEVYSLPTSGGFSMIHYGLTVADPLSTILSHWVPTGTTCYISSWGIATAGQLSTSGAVAKLRIMPGAMGGDSFSLGIIQSLLLAVARVIGLNKSVILQYQTPIAITGPAKIWTTVTPESATLLSFYTFYEFYDVVTG